VLQPIHSNIVSPTNEVSIHLEKTNIKHSPLRVYDQQKVQKLRIEKLLKKEQNLNNVKELDQSLKLQK